jgi:hypothetical protein
MFLFVTIQNVKKNIVEKGNITTMLKIRDGGKAKSYWLVRMPPDGGRSKPAQAAARAFRFT